MILLDEKAGAVGELKPLDRILSGAFEEGGAFGGCAGGEQGVNGAVGLDEVLVGDALDVLRGHAFHRGEITLAEFQIVRGEPIGAEILGLTLHGFTGRKGSGGELFHGLGQFGGGNEIGLHALDLLENGVASRHEFIAVSDTADAEQAGVTRGVDP